jgi:hypothetical protein
MIDAIETRLEEGPSMLGGIFRGETSSGAAVSSTMAGLVAGLHALGGPERVLAGALDEGMTDLHRALLERADYRQALSGALSADWAGEARDAGFLHRSVWSARGASAGLLTVFRQNPLPLYEHPGHAGLLMVVAGEVTVRRYYAVRPADAGSPDRALLRRVGEERLLPGRVCLAWPWRGNVQGLASVAARSVLLRVQVPVAGAEPPCWYARLGDEAQRGMPVRRLAGDLFAAA